MISNQMTKVVQVITIILLILLCINKYLLSVNLFLLFLYLLSMSFTHYKSCQNYNTVHISWISLCAGSSLYFDNFSIELIFIALAPLTMIIHLFKTKEMKMFRWIQTLDAILFIISIIFYNQGNEKIAFTLAITALLIRQAQFPFHIWVHEIKQSKDLFPSIAFFSIVQTGFIVYAHTVLHTVNSGLLQSVIPALTLVTGLVLAVYGLREKDSLTKHLMIIMSQSCLPLAAFHSFSTTSATGGLLFAMVIGLSGTVFGLFAYHFYMQKKIHLINRYYSLYRKNKNLAAIYFVTGFSLVGLPFTVGYIAEDILFHGLIETATYIAPLYIVMAGINGYTIFHLFNHLFFGHTQIEMSAFYQTRVNKALIGITTIMITFGVGMIGQYSSSIEGRLERAHDQNVTKNLLLKERTFRKTSSNN